MARSENRALEDIRRLRLELANKYPEFALAETRELRVEEFCSSIRESLKERRRECNLSQGQLAEKLELDQSVISRIEKSRGDIGLKTVGRVADALSAMPVLTLLDHKNMVGVPGDIEENMARKFRAIFRQKLAEAIPDIIALSLREV